MKTFQDTETGQLYCFEDDADLTKLKIPNTLSENVIPKPSDAHVWYENNWIEKAKAPDNYIAPVSSLPIYNSAWVGFIAPYSIVVTDINDKVEVSLEDVNTDAYNGKMLSKIVAKITLDNSDQVDALISYDGGIAIPYNNNYQKDGDAINKINTILCAILLGGLHVEVVNSSNLQIGALNSDNNIDLYKPSLHNRLRNNMTSLDERLTPLMFPRAIPVADLKNAFNSGILVINAIKNFSPFYLIHGFSAYTHNNLSDALSSLWIVVEQLTSFLWESKFLKTDSLHPTEKINGRLDSLKDNRTYSTCVKHELLWQTKFISENCYSALSSARQRRNKLVHEGLVPEVLIIINLWNNLPELFEKASGLNEFGIRKLSLVNVLETNSQRNYNFDDWAKLSKTL